MARLKIGIVGCGAIGSSLARAICRDFSRQAELSGLYDIRREKAEKLSLLLFKNKKLTAKNLGRLIQEAQLVVEAASCASASGIAKSALRGGRDIMVMSVGGIVSGYPGIFNLAKRHKAKLYIPSGAIAGIDGLKASALGKIKKVVLTTTKNPASFKGVAYLERQGIDLESIKKELVLFSGPAEEAVRYFPQNINVSAVLSLAGIGARKTAVRIIASPQVSRNIHEIEIESQAGRVISRTENLLHPDNPKTSYLAVLSALAVLKQILSPAKVGT